MANHSSFKVPSVSLVPSLILAFSAVLAGPAIGQERSAGLDSARRLIERGRFEKAEESLEKFVESHPESGTAWYMLGSARHGRGDYAGAIEANERASAFPGVRSTALYNCACAQALSGDGEGARASLDEAIAAGFLDFDLIAEDTDLDSIRAHIVLPAAREFSELRGRNGIVIPYCVQLPGEFDPREPTPALVTFAPGSHGPLAASWAIENFWRNAADEKGWILVHLVAPERGWFTHPSHHALEDLLKKIQKDYAIAGERFHLYGFGEGARPALTYAGMSGRYFDSLNVATASAWSRWDDSELRGFKSIPVHQYLGSEDSFTRGEADRVTRLFDRFGVTHSLTVLPDSGPMLEGFSGAALIDSIATRLRSDDEG